MPHAKQHPCPQKLEEMRHGFSPGDFGRSLQLRDFRLPVTELQEYSSPCGSSHRKLVQKMAKMTPHFPYTNSCLNPTLLCSQPSASCTFLPQYLLTTSTHFLFFHGQAPLQGSLALSPPPSTLASVPEGATMPWLCVSTQMDSKLLRDKEPTTIPKYFVQFQTQYPDLNLQMAN